MEVLARRCCCCIWVSPQCSLLCQIPDVVFRQCTAASRHLLGEIKASGSIQGHPWLLAARRRQLWASGGPRPVRGSYRLEHRPWVDNSAPGTILAHHGASLTFNAGSPGY